MMHRVRKARADWTAGTSSLLDAVASLADERLCQHSRRLGSQGDGGWDLCLDLMPPPSKPCAVFSFGVGFDASFDIDIATTYPHCEVITMDPTPSVSMALTADDTLWRELLSGQLCTRAAPKHLSEAGCAISLKRAVARQPARAQSIQALSQAGRPSRLGSPTTLRQACKPSFWSTLSHL